MGCLDLDYSTNRREFRRIVFNNPIQAIIETETSCSEQFKQSIWILDMSAGGLKFVSKSDFPVNFIEIYKFNLTLNNKDLILYGKIIRKKLLTNKIYEYTVEFDFNFSGKLKLNKDC